MSEQQQDRRAPVLTATEVRRLTLFKWRYSLESAGFDKRQADRLLFWKWRVARQGLAS